MTKLGAEDLQFIEGSRSPYGSVLDVNGLEKKEWRILIKSLEKWVAIGGEPCKECGSTIKIRRGDCLPCGKQTNEFALSRLKFNHIYVAGSSKGEFLKIGSSKNFKKNVETLNKHGYGGVNDWQAIIAFEVTRADRVEFQIFQKIKKFFVPEHTRMGGREVTCLDIIKCKFSRAKKALIDSIHNQSLQIFLDNNLAKYFEKISENYIDEEREEEFVYLDTETTGVPAWEHKIVEISIIDDEGNILLDTLVNPEREIPEEATNIHGITNEMVKSYGTIEEFIPKINNLIRGKKLVIYNSKYDTGFFPDKLGQAATICCALRAYQSHMKIGKGSSLSNAVNHIGYKWEGKAHRALADTRACRSVWRWLLEQDPELEHSHSHF